MDALAKQSHLPHPIRSGSAKAQPLPRVAFQFMRSNDGRADVEAMAAFWRGASLRGREVSAESEISVAMAVYNGERFILEQLKSLAHQTHLPDEMVVSDDCSTDRTVRIVTEFARHAPFSIKVLTNDKNVGCTKNYERAIRDCSGDVIFLCDCDDVWYPRKIAIMERAFKTQPNSPWCKWSRLRSSRWW